MLSDKCRIPIESDVKLKVGKWDFDGDKKDDLFVDLPSQLLADAQCTVGSTRISWLSTKDFQPEFGDQVSANSAEQAAEAEPAAALEASQPAASSTPPAPQSVRETVAESSTEQVTGTNGSQAPRTRPEPSTPWYQTGVGVGAIAFLAVGLAVAFLMAIARFCTHVRDRYQYNVILNWWNALYVPILLAGGFGAFFLLENREAGLAMLTFAGLMLLVRVVVNIRATGLGIGLLITTIQPFAVLLIIFAGLTLRGMATSGSRHAAAERGRLHRIREHEQRVRGYVGH
jgi:hypothetical protein